MPWDDEPARDGGPNVCQIAAAPVATVTSAKPAASARGDVTLITLSRFAAARVGACAMAARLTSNAAPNGRASLCLHAREHFTVRGVA